MRRRPTLGVVGGGQLARMMLQESIPLGVDMRFLVTDPAEPAAAAGGRHMLGSATSADDLRAFASTVDVVTFDHEVVDLAALTELAAGGAVVRPGPACFSVVADKARMRSALAAAGVPVPPSVIPGSGDEAAALVTGGGTHVFKLAHGGYDGRGTHFVADPAHARRLVDGIVSSGGRVLAEPMLDLEGEMAVLVVNRPGGNGVTYDPVETIQVDGQCRRIDAPSPRPPSVLAAARRLAEQAADAVGAVGVLAVEMFVTGGELLVNELAARPHNSGHHTLDAATTSQFSQHVRAVIDLPLGDTALTAAAASTGNVIGRDARTDPRDRLPAALAVDDRAHIHLYGKQPRPDRKLGHVTVCDDDPARAVRRVRAVVEALGGQEVPG